MARNQKLSYKMNMFPFLTKQNYSKYSRLFEGGRLFEGAFILKSEILGGVHSRGAFIRGWAFIRGNTV